MLLIVTFSLCNVYTQSTSPNDPTANISTYALKDYNSSLQKNTAPDVGAFHETKLVSVDNHRGAANINVLLYTIKQGGVTIPIRLNYLSTGVKVNSIASSVGLNWSLEAGGSILKDIKGFEDFSSTYEKTEVAPSIPYPGDGSPIIQLNKRGWFVEEGPFSIDEKNTQFDSSADHFIVNAPGLNTSFTHQKSNGTDITEPVEVRFQNNEIKTTIGYSNLIDFYYAPFNVTLPELISEPFPKTTETKDSIRCINKIEIKNNQGINYLFDKLDVDQYLKTQIASSETSADFPALDKYNYSQEVKSYHLSTITDLNGDVIDFEYETYQVSNDDYNRTHVWDINERNPELRKTIYTSVFYPQLHRIKKIYFKTGSVEFIYGFNRTDTKDGGQALSEIIVRDTHGSFIEKTRLDYTYFVSNNGCDEYYCKRLQLKEVYKEDEQGTALPSHQFFYDQTPLPVVGTTTTDYLGYSKGLKDSYADDLNPNIPWQAPKLTYHAFYGITNFSDPIFYTSPIIEIEGRDLTPVFDYAKAASLTKIITPTGASQEFEYELNSYDFYNSTQTQAAGLRIKRQTITDEKGDVVLLENYTYSPGVVNYLPSNIQVSSDTDEDYLTPHTTYYFQWVGTRLRMRTYLSSKNENYLSSPNHIVYPQVTVKNGLNNGVKIYNYSTINSKDRADFISSSNDSNSLIDINDDDDYEKTSILHGLLTSTTTKDVYDNTLHNTIFHYNYKFFNEIGTNHVKYQGTPFGEDPIAQYYYNRKGNKSPSLDIYSERVMQTKVEEIKIYPDTNTKITTTSELVYDATYPFVKEKIDYLDDATIVTTKNYYSHDTNYISTDSFNTSANLLNSKRMLSYPIQVERYLNDDLLTTRRTDYKDFGNNIYAPERLLVSKGINELETSVKQQYDTKGNLVEVSREDGTSIVYIYGYDKSLLVAEIVNATLSDIPDAFLTKIQEASNSDNDRTIDILNTNKIISSHVGSEGALRSELYKLYTLSTLDKALISTYTYDPLIGITSITDSRGKITYYDYDSFNRLQFIKDQEGNILEQHCYNYKGERKNCDIKN